MIAICKEDGAQVRKWARLCANAARSTDATEGYPHPRLEVSTPQVSHPRRLGTQFADDFWKSAGNINGLNGDEHALANPRLPGRPLGHAPTLQGSQGCAIRPRKSTGSPDGAQLAPGTPQRSPRPPRQAHHHYLRPQPKGFLEESKEFLASNSPGRV